MFFREKGEVTQRLARIAVLKMILRKLITGVIIMITTIRLLRSIKIKRISIAKKIIYIIIRTMTMIKIHIEQYRKH